MTRVSSAAATVVSAAISAAMCAACGPSSSGSTGTTGILSPPAANEQAPSGVTVSRTATKTVGSREVSSSTRLAVKWSQVGDTPNHIRITATESVQNTSVSATAAASATSATLTTLKANTTYAVVVTACWDASCSRSNAATAVSASTDAEYWQLVGTGNSIDTLTKIVADGNARLSATRLGPDATPVANQVQLYYGPLSSGSSGRSPLAVATTTRPASASDTSTYLSFTSRSGVSGLTSPPSAAPLVATVLTGQGVPLSRGLGGKVRLFFEATGADNKTRVLSMDSQDGYLGLDFNSGGATSCSTTADYSAGGGCQPTVAIGVEGDAVAANTKIANARQQKVGWPAMDSPEWDGAAGTFMVFTTDTISGCTTAFMNHGYAVWDGSAWKVQYLSSGCPKLFTNAQAALPMHLGGVRYKMYYGDPSVTAGKISSSPLPFVGPKMLIYADGARTSPSATVEFEDWEAQSSARDVVFLWPNGDQMDAAAEGYIDDYHFLAPTGSLDLQVMYLTITNGVQIPFASAAVLVNP